MNANFPGIVFAARLAEEAEDALSSAFSQTMPPRHTRGMPRENAFAVLTVGMES